MIEESMRIKISKGEIARAIVLCVGIAGIVTVAATCPNIIQLARPFLRTRYKRSSYYQALKRLESRHIIAISQDGNRWSFQLTKDGRKLYDEIELGNIHIQVPKRWDGKWRVLVFDFPEQERSKRDRIRQALIQLGFVRLQDSVWVHPYECRPLMDILRVRFGAFSEALYLVAEKMDGDRRLRKHFGLK
jgi:DNA-binding transcriptional regulator PaaX